MSPWTTHLTDDEIKRFARAILDGEPIEDKYRPLLAWTLLGQLGKKSPRLETRYREFQILAWLGIKLLGIKLLQAENQKPKLEPLLDDAAKMFGLTTRHIKRIIAKSPWGEVLRELHRGGSGEALRSDLNRKNRSLGQ